MRLLNYKDLDLRRVKAAFDKVKAAIEADDFRSADVKKLHAGPYYRAKLDYANRLLLQFARIGRAQGDGVTETVCLALEVIENHAYERSRFLRGAAVDESRIERKAVTDSKAPALAAEASPLRWLGPGRTQFELLGKPIVFDDSQDEAYRHPAPLVVIGSAGSGKTAVTLARLREAEGRVLYVTLSAYLAQSARALHAAHGFENPKQEVDFLSYRELLETLRVPPGREVTLSMFAAWCERHHASLRQLGDIDAQALFEEFRGVIGAQPQGPLPLADYLALGTRQSLLNTAQRELAHGLFQRYRTWLAEAGLRQQPGRSCMAHRDRAKAAADLRLRRHRRGAGPHAGAAGAGAGAAEASRAVHPVRRQPPDRAPQLLQLGGAEELVLAGPGR